MREKFPVAFVMQSESDGIIKPAEAGVNWQVGEWGLVDIIKKVLPIMGAPSSL